MDGLLDALKNPWLTTIVTTQSLMWASIAYGTYRAGRVKGVGLGSKRAADELLRLVKKQDEYIAVQKQQIDSLEDTVVLQRQQVENLEKAGALYEQLRGAVERTEGKE